MAKRAELETKCPCGNTLSFIVDKPTLLTQTVARKSCGACGSRYLFKCKMVGTNDGKRISIDPDILFLSKKAQAVVSEKLEARKALNGTDRSAEK